MTLTKPIFLLLFSFIVLDTHAATTLVINTTGKPPLNTPEQTGFMDKVAAEALRRLGLKLQTVQLPAERGLKNANMGIEDGEMSRIAGLESVYPNLIRVPEKIMDWEFVAYSSQPIDVAGGWANLAPYSVSFINGWKILEKNIPQQTAVTKVRNPRQLFMMLKKRRADLVIYERWGALPLLNDLALTNVKMLTPPLATREMFIYLHKKHHALVPKVARALRDMKRDGTYDRLFAETLTPWTKGQAQ